MHSRTKMGKPHSKIQPSRASYDFSNARAGADFCIIDKNHLDINEKYVSM